MGGLFSGNSKASTSTADRRIAATDQATVTQVEGSGAAATATGATSVSVSGSNISDSSKTALLTEGSQAGNITITNNDAGLLDSLAGKFLAASQQQTEAFSSLLTASKEDKQTGPETVSPDLWTVGQKWAAGIVVAVLLGWLVFSKKGKA